MNGTLEQAGELWRLRFIRPLAHPPERVWRALTAPGERSAWFPDSVEGDFTTVGAQLVFAHPGGEFHGEVTACEPPVLLELMWGSDRLRFEIARTADGCTLTLTDTFAELGKAARDGAGWHECLDNLVRALAGTPPAPPGAHWRQLHAEYVETLGPEAATIGPPPGRQPPA